MALDPATTVAPRIALSVDQDDPQILQVGGLVLDCQLRTVFKDGEPVLLSPTLFRLLRVLMSHPHEVLSREFLFKQVWQTDYTGDMRTLEVHVCLLRKKIELDPRRPHYLRTSRGRGYWLGEGD